MDDTYRHKGLRKKLVAEIQNKGINDEKVLNAIGKVPRHLFMDSGFINFAYKDQAFPIKAGQTISQPYTVAFQTSLLDISEGDRVLEIGTGSGYQTAILLEMGAKVYSIERTQNIEKRNNKQVVIHFDYSDKQKDGSKLKAYYHGRGIHSLDENFPTRLINILAPVRISEFFSMMVKNSKIILTIHPEKKLRILFLKFHS